MADIDKDSRVLSLGSRPGLRQSLVTLLDQLGRCQKALNEFLEVLNFILWETNHFLSVSLVGEESCVSKVLFPG